MESRIIELVSNASQELYPGNTVSSFTNFLPDDVTFEGEWEVALMELTVPGRWLNVTEGKFVLMDIYHENFRDPEHQTTLTLPPGQYESIYSIKTVMNDLAEQKDLTERRLLLLNLLMTDDFELTKNRNIAHFQC